MSTQGTTLVLVCNLGTPETPLPSSIRGFLRGFLTDRRVIDLHPLLWYPILYGLILPFRPSSLSKLYSDIWIQLPKESYDTLTDVQYKGSPLLYYTERLAAKMQAQYPPESRVVVTAAMHCRGAGRTIKEALQSAHSQYKNLTNVVILPLFPHYSSTTVAGVFDDVFQFYGNPRCRFIPSLHFIRDYAESPAYLDCVAWSIVRRMEKHFGGPKTAAEWGALIKGLNGELAIVLTYHSIPQRYVEEGDDYNNRCSLTTRGLASRLEASLGTDASSIILQVYQSRFGSSAWLEPFLTDAMQALPAAADAPLNGKGVKAAFADQLGDHQYATRVVKTCVIAAPGFSADCLETLHEIRDEAQEIFLQHGGSDFLYVPCLNDSDPHARALVSVLKPFV